MSSSARRDNRCAVTCMQEKLLRVGFQSSALRVMVDIFCRSFDGSFGFQFNLLKYLQ